MFVGTCERMVEMNEEEECVRCGLLISAIEALRAENEENIRRMEERIRREREELQHGAAV